MNYEDNITVRTAGGLEFDLAIAGIGSRSYAFIADWHVRLIVALGWFFIVLYINRLLGSASGQLFDFEGWGGPLVFYGGFLPAMAIYLLYHPVLEIVMKGRTPGKRMAGIRIVDESGQAPAVGAILIRNVFRVIDQLPGWYMLGLAVCLFTKRQVRIGDIAAHTLLVHEEKVKSEAIDFMADVARESSVLTPRQIEALHELVDRWRTLDRTARMRMARKMLDIVKEEVPGDRSDSELDQWMFNRLQALRNG